MENKLNAVQVMPVSEIMTMAKNFADSGMFTDAKQMGQAFVKIQAGQEIGIPPFAAMSGIHIIQGKPTIGAGLIASRVKGSGKYDYEVKEMSDKNCSIDFFQGKKLIGNSSFNLEDAKKAQTKNLDKFPKNMLFARAISNGVKWFCPDVFAGPVYTPEEMNTESQPPETIETTYVDVTVQDAETHKEEVRQILLAATTKDELAEAYKSLEKQDQKAWAEYTKKLKAQFEQAEKQNQDNE